MIKVLFSLGVVMTLGSGALAYDYVVQSAKHPDEILDLADYAAALQIRTVDLMEQEVRPRIASLPQVAKGLGAAAFDGDVPSNAEQIDDFTKDSPQLQAMVKSSRAQAKESWWARIRQKVTGDNGEPRTNRLADIRERNFPKPRVGIDPSSLSGQSATQLYANRAQISQGLSNGAINNMNAVVSGMEENGVDMSVYSLD
jgi:hypothetical protein